MGKISQTALSVFRDCEFAYKCYKNRCEAIFFDESVLLTGKYVHEAIDKYYKNHYLTKATPDDILIETYGILKRIWDVTLPIEEFKKAYACLENHAKWESNNSNNGIGTKPLTEIEVKSEFFYGIIDYVDLTHKKIYDWKTGKSAKLYVGNRIQASIYKELYEYQFKEKLNEFTFFFLYTGVQETVRYGTTKQNEIDQEVQMLKEHILKANEIGEYQKNPRTESMCRYCNYRLYCKILS
jgi:hypothetical protein